MKSICFFFCQSLSIIKVIIIIIIYMMYYCNDDNVKLKNKTKNGQELKKKNVMEPAELRKKRPLSVSLVILPGSYSFRILFFVSIVCGGYVCDYTLLFIRESPRSSFENVQFLWI